MADLSFGFLSNSCATACRKGKNLSLRSRTLSPRRLGDGKVFYFIFIIFLFGFLGPAAALSQSHSPVVINEISFKPNWSSITNCSIQSWFEWVEVKNVSDSVVDLAGWVLSDNSSSDNLSGTIPAGGYAVIVARESCFRANFPSFSGTLINLESYLGNGLADSGDKVVIKDQGAVIVDSADFTSGWPGTNIVARDPQGNWQEATPTPGAENSTGVLPPPPPPPLAQQTETSSPQPAVTFSAPSSVASGQEFSVGVSLSNFVPGTYSVKVLVGKDGKFIYGNTEVVSGWLTQSASWADFPTISRSGTVQAKVDDDAAAGDYLIKVRVHKDGTNYDSEEKPLSVLPAPLGQNPDPSTVSIAASVEGTVLGEGVSPAPQKETPKLNFYIIVGIFGLLVGGGGLILAFRGKLLGL